MAPLTFETISSIGVRSGLYGGGTTRAPAPSTGSSDLCGLTLSQMTTSLSIDPNPYEVAETELLRGLRLS